MSDDKGFTLIELLVVILMIAVLSAIAVLQFNNYKIRALDARAVSSMKRLVEAQENYFVDNEEYAANTTDLTNWVDDVNITTVMTASDDDSWAGYAYHSGGSVRYCYNTDTKSGISSVAGVATACP